MEKNITKEVSFTFVHEISLYLKWLQWTIHSGNKDYIQVHKKQRHFLQLINKEVSHRYNKNIIVQVFHTVSCSSEQKFNFLEISMAIILSQILTLKLWIWNKN